MTLSEKILSWKRSISNRDDLKGVLKELIHFCEKENRLISDITNISGRFHHYDNKEIIGTITGSDPERNTLRSNIVRFIDKLEANMTDFSVALTEEQKTAIEKEKKDIEKKYDLTNHENEQLTVTISNLQKKYDKCISEMKIKDDRISTLESTIKKHKITNIIGNKWFIGVVLLVFVVASYYIGKYNVPRMDPVQKESAAVTSDTNNFAAAAKRWKKDSSFLRDLLRIKDSDFNKLKKELDDFRKKYHVPLLPPPKPQIECTLIAVPEPEINDENINKIINTLVITQQNNINIKYLLKVKYNFSGEEKKRIQITIEENNKVIISDFVDTNSLTIELKAKVLEWLKQKSK